MFFDVIPKLNCFLNGLADTDGKRRSCLRVWWPELRWHDVWSMLCLPRMTDILMFSREGIVYGTSQM